jgi:inner membrane transporter RhtA
VSRPVLRAASWPSASGVPAPLLVVVAILSVQTGSAIARTMFDDVGAPGVTLLRLGIASVILLLVLRPRLRTWSAASLRAAAVLGVVMASMNLTFYLSLRTVPLGVAVTVEFIGPLTLALVQTRRWRDLAWALLAALGVVLLGVDHTSGIPVTGLLLALTAGMFWAGYILASARVGRLLPGVDGLSVALAVGALLMLPLGIRGALHVLGHPSWVLAALAVALLSSIIPYGLELTALRRIPTRVFGILMSGEPAAAALAGFIVLGQHLQPRQWVALALVSAASVGVTVAQREGDVPPQPLE